MPERSEQDELGAKVIEVIARTQRIPADSISLNSTFEELKIDSLDGINIVFELEKAFNIEIPDEGAQNLRSVSETVEGVRKLLGLKRQQQTAPSGAA
ncbi:MAG: acyl carrier protein [Acidobacteriaceae bacterium]|nr:acyl carrier protein [Acidobacteriaceae bacterium]MBV8573332.1 acyl carrier protein [Acidobacteriaceae bacterium]